MKSVGLLFAMLCSAGCMAHNDSRLKKAEESAAAVDSLKNGLDALDTRVSDHDLQLLELKVKAEAFETAVFDPGSPGECPAGC